MAVFSNIPEIIPAEPDEALSELGKEIRNAQDLREVFLQSVAPKILQRIVLSADGKAGFVPASVVDRDVLENCVKSLLKMIEQAEDRHVINIDAGSAVNSVDQIINLVAEGKLQVSEAKRFAELLQVKFDMNELKEALNMLKSPDGSGEDNTVVRV